MSTTGATAMTYANRSDMMERFTELELAELESSHTDGYQATEKALNDSSQMMNSYLSVRYHTPLAHSEHLTLICCNIARFLLYKNSATDEVERRYNEAIKWLKDVSNEKANVTFAESVSDDEQASSHIAPATPIGDSYKGDVFGDEVFSKMPSIK